MTERDCHGMSRSSRSVSRCSWRDGRDCHGVGPVTLLLAAFIFGCAHLDNGPGPLPNWRYMILATIAGVAYGKVFEKSSSIFASAGLHALVDLIKHVCF